MDAEPAVLYRHHERLRSAGAGLLNPGQSALQGSRQVRTFRAALRWQARERGVRTKTIADARVDVCNVAFHSITSSARASSVGGTMMPSAFAVFRLITSSNLVGCSTGRSAGFAPLKILSTKRADRRNRSRRSGP